MSVNFPAIRPSDRSFRPPSIPAGRQRMENRRQFRTLVVGAEGGGTLSFRFKVDDSGAELIRQAYRLSRGTYESLNLPPELFSGDPDLLAFVSGMGGQWRFAGPPVIEWSKRGRVEVSVELVHRRRSVLSLPPPTSTSPSVPVRPGLPDPGPIGPPPPDTDNEIGEFVYPSSRIEFLGVSDADLSSDNFNEYGNYPTYTGGTVALPDGTGYIWIVGGRPTSQGFFYNGMTTITCSNTDGTVRWQTTVERFNSYFVPFIDVNNKLIVVGTSRTNNNDTYKIHIARLALTGTIEDIATFDTGSTDGWYGSGADGLSDGRIVLMLGGAVTTGGTFPQRLWFIAADLSSATVKTYTTAHEFFHTENLMVVDRTTDTIYMSGNRSIVGGARSVLAKIDSTGAVIKAVDIGISVFDGNPGGGFDGNYLLMDLDNDSLLVAARKIPAPGGYILFKIAKSDLSISAARSIRWPSRLVWDTVSAPPIAIDTWPSAYWGIKRSGGGIFLVGDIYWGYGYSGGGTVAVALNSLLDIDFAVETWPLPDTYHMYAYNYVYNPPCLLQDYLIVPIYGLNTYVGTVYGSYDLYSAGVICLHLGDAATGNFAGGFGKQQMVMWKAVNPQSLANVTGASADLTSQVLVTGTSAVNRVAPNPTDTVQIATPPEFQKILTYRSNALAPVAAPSASSATPVYSQSSVYSGNSAATLSGMTNSVYAEALETATGQQVTYGVGYVQIDLQTVRQISQITVGVDYDNTLAGGWGAYYGEGCPIWASRDGTNWFFVTDAYGFVDTGPTPSGIKSYAVDIQARYLRAVALYDTEYLAITEFSVQ